ncbi:unnamed protein product, partial [Hymenolepis diminuta]
KTTASSKGKSSSWDANIYEILLSANFPEKSPPFPIEGGSDAGLFCTVGRNINPSQLIYHPIISSPTPNSPKKSPSILRPGDIILEVGDYHISGFTRLDAMRLCENLFYSSKDGDQPRVLLKLISPSVLPTGDAHLNRFLAAQFKVGTPEFLLQEVTRNNIYQRVVPCTTREPRPEERDGVHYQFLDVERFLALEKSGHLLESGMYKGNHYGTPRPDANASALNLETIGGSAENTLKECTTENGSASVTTSDTNGRNSIISAESANVNEQQTSLTQVQHSSSGRDLSSIPLPSGWEVIDHPEYGLFYVDHIHQKTQYDPPTQADFEESARLQAAVTGSCSSAASTTSTENNPNGNGSIHSSNGSRPGVAGSVSSGSDRFTDDVAQIKGPLVTAVLTKGTKGFGFTIIGGSSPGHPGFLQIKNVIPGGAAAQDGTLGVGNVIVSANGVSVLGYSHDQIVALFQSIPVGGTVSLTVSQEYSLTHNGNAIGAKKPKVSSTTRGVKPGNLERSVPFAPPELCIRRLNTSPTISQLSGEEGEDEGIMTSGSRSNGGSGGAVVTVPVSVTKQPNGFGFTLADQIGGQRVKEVLEPTGLRVGDVILEVNGKWVKDLTHLEVVQVLKTCPVGKTTDFLIQRAIPISADRTHTDASLNPNFTRIPGCDSPLSFDGADMNDFSPNNGFYPVFHPSDYNTSTTISTSGSTRYRSRTPGPGEEPRRDGVPGLGNSSDCIYSLGESLNGLELFRCPSPPSNGGGVWTAGLKRYGGTEFDTYCLQQGLSRNNLLGGLPLNLEYESLPRGSSMIGPHLFGEFFVNLRRETNGFGFKLLGGLEEGTQVTIGSLAPGGAAERSGQMRAGDRLVSVNGARVFGGTHARALELLERAAETHGEVTLGLWRSSPPVPNSNSTSGSTESSETRCWPSTQPSKTSIRSVLLQRNSGEEGFGFVLANLKSSTSRHPGDHFIARVVPGSASDRSRLLHVGDRLISVNGVNVTNLPREEVIRLVKSSGSQLALSFLPHSAPAMPSYEQMQFYNSQLSHNQQQEQYQHHQKARAVFFQVTLFRSSRGFGFSIRGGHEFNQMPLTVLRVAEGGPAYLDGRLKVGDELLQINGFMTAGMSHRRAVEIIQAGGNMIRLGVRRLLPPLLPPQITTSSDVKYQSPPPPMSYAPFPPPMPALNSSPVPPNLRLPQLFTPLPVHKAPSSSQRALLSPVVQ